MKDCTAKEQIFLLDIMIGNVWLFLDRTSLFFFIGNAEIKTSDVKGVMKIEIQSGALNWYHFFIISKK